MSSISAVVKSIQDVMRQDAGIDGDAQRIGQLAWMFFLKIFDDREAEAELLDSDYRSPIPSDLRWRTWAAPKEGITGDALVGFVNNNLFPTLKQFAETSTTGRSNVIGNVFQDAFNYMKNGTLIRQVVNKINEIDFNRSEDRHLFGDIYEQILKGLQSAGNSGEYYTPRAVTQFMIDIVSPNLGESVLDPACGTGGFLTGAIEHVRANHVRTPDDEQILQSSIRGVEKKQLPHLLCTTNMLLHGIDVPTNIDHDNTLARPLRDYTSKDRVDVILTNPPFGGIEEPGVENNFPQAYRTRETADLFLILIQHRLKTGGRAAVVLPDGTLFGDGVKARIKEKLLTDCNLHTIVRLPKGVFNPYTGIATNLLFFTKGEPTKEIWYYEHQYPAGYKNYSKTKPIRLEEFEAEKAWWHDRVESQVAWKVSIEQIRENNWNLDVDNPNDVDPSHRDPAELLDDLQIAERGFAELRDSLREELAGAASNASLPPGTFRSAFAPMMESDAGLDKLQALILDLAMRGSLTERAHSDEPARELLARVKSERERFLDAAGGRRRTKTYSALQDADVPYKAPHGWEWSRAVDLIHTVNGRAFKPTEWSSDGLPIIRIQNLNNTKAPFNHFKGEVAPGHRVEPGDLLISWSGTPGTSFGAFVWDGPPGVLNQHIFKCTLFEDYRDFICLAINSRLDVLIGDAHGGVGLQHFTKDKLERLPLPVPPLEEQRRIVDRVRHLLGMCAELREGRAKLRKLTGDLAASVVAHAG
ncbi:type I restriction enzyme M protein [Microbacterium terrae]|nr:N-6 DNA methylase [Microbacterium terrae]MBP1076724.1 type I restriction enzyme M protein [Microbacterium terrae]GLJ97555.1 hypothetical protein GCM10017594_07520 [Microbacterium terrae]